MIHMEAIGMTVVFLKIIKYAFNWSNDSKNIYSASTTDIVGVFWVIAYWHKSIEPNTQVFMIFLSHNTV